MSARFFIRFRQAAPIAMRIMFALLLPASMATAQQPDSALPSLVDARVLSTPERARLVVDLSGPTEFAIASLGLPDRIAVDVRVSAVEMAAPAPPASGGLVSAFTVEQAGPGRARTILVLSAPAQVQQAYVLEAFESQPARLVVDLIPDEPERFAQRVSEDLAASTLRGSQDIIVAPPPVLEGASAATRSRPLVVIDPGHGGVDGGAAAPNGMREKDIVLAFALELQRLLVATDRFDVALTRDDDSFLRLEERVQLARDNKADLFISIHADSFQDPLVRGASIYTRDERATDVLDKVLAERENRSNLIAGFRLPAVEDAAVAILVDLLRREMRRQAYIAAQAIVSELQPGVRLRRFPVRQADFFVLQAPDVPSLLVELGFLSNEEDISNLTAGRWRDRTAEALARGILAYFDELLQN